MGFTYRDLQFANDMVIFRALDKSCKALGIVCRRTDRNESASIGSANRKHRCDDSEVGEVEGK